MQRQQIRTPMLGSTGGIDGLGDAPWARGRYQSIWWAKPVQQQKAARTTSTEEQNKYPILFAIGDPGAPPPPTQEKALPASRSSASLATPSRRCSTLVWSSGRRAFRYPIIKRTASSRLRTTMSPFSVKGGSNLYSGMAWPTSVRPRGYCQLFDFLNDLVRNGTDHPYPVLVVLSRPVEPIRRACRRLAAAPIAMTVNRRDGDMVRRAATIQTDPLSRLGIRRAALAAPFFV